MASRVCLHFHTILDILYTINAKILRYFVATFFCKFEYKMWCVFCSFPFSSCHIYTICLSSLLLSFHLLRVCAATFIFSLYTMHTYHFECMFPSVVVRYSVFFFPSTFMLLYINFAFIFSIDINNIMILTILSYLKTGTYCCVYDCWRLA